jgi:hypothetical protein
MLIFTMIFLAILISLSYANRSVKEEITESDFHIRILFREPRNDFTDNQLQQYMLERGLEQNPPQ